MWEGAHFEASSAHEVCMRNSAAIGACSVYKEIQDLEYETFFERQTDERGTNAEGSTLG